jgi:biopolymer transport protein ExbD
MRDRTSKPQEQGQAIDLTPMLDVVFIMLIFFIVTASFIKLPGVEVNKENQHNKYHIKHWGQINCLPLLLWFTCSIAHK